MNLGAFKHRISNLFSVRHGNAIYTNEMKLSNYFLQGFKIFCNSSHEQLMSETI